MDFSRLRISDYDYDLPEERIAQHPVTNRDDSKLLLFDGENISSDVFINLHKYISPGSLLVFNDSKVIKARLLFQKQSGAVIEILCLEPVNPPGYEESLSSHESTEWKCIVGNLKKWKSGKVTMAFKSGEEYYTLTAERIANLGDAWNIRFAWNCKNINFGEVIQSAGHMPLPPYITRNDEEEDSKRYQTIYSSVEGSVAAPTAGLHFTSGVLERLKSRQIRRTDITLHVGAGTFQPVRSENISEHTMHFERFYITIETLDRLLSGLHKIIAVGTTSVRTLESLYWLGVNILDGKAKNIKELRVDQWEPYTREPVYTAGEALTAVRSYILKMNTDLLEASTGIIILPGYKFRITNGIITNFHQPRSTLLLLISAWTGEKWKEIYDFALGNEFRFLSYGDSSLLLRSQC